MSDTSATVIGGPKRVLVLDDEAIILMDLEFSLQDEGFEPVIANTVERALELIEEQAPHAAVLDVNLGHGRTCEPVAERLRALGVPFLLHTGDLERRGELVTGFDAPIVSKPSAPDEIAQALRKL